MKPADKFAVLMVMVRLMKDERRQREFTDQADAALALMTEGECTFADIVLSETIHDATAHLKVEGWTVAGVIARVRSEIRYLKTRTNMRGPTETA